MPDKHIVYVLRSLSEPKRPYIGLTHDVGARLDAHNAGRCAHTARYRPWGVVAAIMLADEPTAIRFERYLKSGSGRAFAKRHFGPQRAPLRPLQSTCLRTTHTGLGGAYRSRDRAGTGARPRASRRALSAVSH